MSTDTTHPTTNRPKIELGPGGIYYYTDPATGKTHTSPSYNGLLADLEDKATAQDRAARQQAEREQQRAERQQAATTRLADLTPRLDAAEQDRDTAHERFRHDALTGGPYVEAYAAYLAAFRRHDALRLHVIDARHEAQHGHDKRGGGANARPPTLTEALDRLVTDRAAELQAATTER